MYNAQHIAERIKNQARKKSIQLKNMLSDIGLGINIVSQLSNGREISSFSLAKIADYLDCSVDYLLCRTENPEAHNTSASVNNVPTTDEQLAEIIKIYEQLSSLGKAKVYVFIDEVLGKERTGNLP